MVWSTDLLMKTDHGLADASNMLGVVGSNMLIWGFRQVGCGQCEVRVACDVRVACGVWRVTCDV